MRYVKDLYRDIFNTLLREIEDLNKWGNIPCPWIIDSVLLRSQLSPNWSIDSMQFQSHHIYGGFVGEEVDWQTF